MLVIFMFSHGYTYLCIKMNFYIPIFLCYFEINIDIRPVSLPDALKLFSSCKHFFFSEESYIFDFTYLWEILPSYSQICRNFMSELSHFLSVIQIFKYKM